MVPAFIPLRYFLTAIAVVAHATVADNTSKSPRVPSLSVKKFFGVLVVTSSPDIIINEIPT